MRSEHGALGFLEIRKGAIALLGSRLVRIEERLSADRVRVLDVATGKQRQTSVANLRGHRATIDEVDVDARAEQVRTVSEAQWSEAVRREQVICKLLASDGTLKQGAEGAARELSVSSRTILRWLSRYRMTTQTSSLVRHPRGIVAGTHRLDLTRERLIARIIREHYLSHTRPPIAEIVRIAHDSCIARGLQPISRNAIRMRIAQLDPCLITKARYGAEAARRMHDPTPGRFPVDHPLDSVQIDHALADLEVVDERDRAAAGRPWLTLAIDVCTRAVLGFYASLDPPSSTSIALCLAQACLPKDAWLASRNLSDVSWPMCGIPKVLRADNGRDFRSEALRRGCDEAGIALEFRPPATPHFGGHIERLIGSVMGRLHLLPGTTFSNPKARGKYDSAKHAAFTLAEFERYLALEIAERYHNSFHRGLRSSPTLVWKQAVMTLPSHRIPADPTRFLRSFLPVEFRRLQKDGIWLFNIRYWSDVLPTIAQRHDQLVVRYDPRNLAKVFVLAPDKSYVEVPYADVRHPPISLWDLKVAARFLRERGEKQKTEQRLFWANSELARMATAATTETRRVRRLRARRETTARERHRTMADDRDANSVEVGVDYSRTPRDLPVEPGTIGRHR